MFKVDKEKCIGCKKCVSVCPVGAIKIIDGKAEIDKVNQPFFPPFQSPFFGGGMGRRGSGFRRGMGRGRGKGGGRGRW